MFYNAYELFDKGRYQECLPMFNEILKTSDDERVNYWSNVLIGRSKELLGQDGLESFLLAQKIFTERAEALCDIGMHHYRRNNFPEAERFFRMAIACSKSHRCIRYEEEKYFEFPMQMLVELYMEQRRYNDSEEALAEILRLGNPARYSSENVQRDYLYARHYNNAGLEFAKAKTIEASGTLVLQLPNGYDGLGDNLVFSHIPRIAKESGRFNRVLVSTRNIYKGNDYPRIVWQTNPYVDGFTDEPGTYSSVHMNRVMDKWINIQHSINLMDSIMILHDLDNRKRGHTPECYYKPNIMDGLKNSTVLDLGAKTIDLTKLNFNNLLGLLEKNGIRPDYVLSSKSIETPGIEVLQTSSIEHWADVMCSAKNYICFNSGGYWLSGALGVKAKHIWIERKNLPAWSYLDHDNIFVTQSTIYQEDI